MTKGKRPPYVKKTSFIGLRSDQAIRSAVEMWAARRDVTLSAAVRRLVEIGLAFEAGRAIGSEEIETERGQILIHDVVRKH
jgi:hypothetical protein